MTTEPDQSTSKPKKKVTRKRKKSTTAKRKPRKAPARTVAPPPPLTIEELKEGREAKQEIVNAVVEPAVEVVGSLSQTIRDTISGAFAGLLSRKRRKD
jgi:hypothetical protein